MAVAAVSSAVVSRFKDSAMEINYNMVCSKDTPSDHFDFDLEFPKNNEIVILKSRHFYYRNFFIKINI